MSQRQNKVVDKYPIPQICDYCGSRVKLVSNSVIYSTEYGNGKCYKCVNCDAYVGVHPDLETPLGRLANKELRTLKKQAHSIFDTIWQSGEMSRRAAYKKLANELGIPAGECHFGWFDRDMLQRAIQIMSHSGNYVKEAMPCFTSR